MYILKPVEIFKDGKRKFCFQLRYKARTTIDGYLLPEINNENGETVLTIKHSQEVVSGRYVYSNLIIEPELNFQVKTNLSIFINDFVWKGIILSNDSTYIIKSIITSGIHLTDSILQKICPPVKGIEIFKMINFKQLNRYKTFTNLYVCTIPANQNLVFKSDPVSLFCKDAFEGAAQIEIKDSLLIIKSGPKDYFDSEYEKLIGSVILYKNTILIVPSPYSKSLSGFDPVIPYDMIMIPNQGHHVEFLNHKW
jgi:hypothetical protein